MLLLQQLVCYAAILPKITTINKFITTSVTKATTTTSPLLLEDYCNLTHLHANSTKAVLRHVIPLAAATVLLPKYLGTTCRASVAASCT
jgi:hypothetical protein